MKKLNFKNLNFYKNKNVIITGNTGFKGSWLSIWLIDLGANVLGISKDIVTKPSLFKLAQLDQKMKTLFFDVSDLNKLKKTINKFKPDIIFNLAAQSIVSESFIDPINTFKSNTFGTLSLLEVLRTYKRKCGAVFITSDKCYYPTSRAYYSEKSKLGGIDPYSGSKAAAEILIENYYQSFLKKKNNIAICSVRAGNVIGGGDWTVNRIIPDLYKSLLNKKKFKIRNPNSNRPWQHVIEPLAAYLFLGQNLFKKKKINGQSFNVGPSVKNNISVENLIKKITNKEDYNCKIIVNKKKYFAESDKLNLNTSKIKKYIGWQNKLSTEKISEYIVLWYKSFRKNKKNIYDFTLRQIKNYSKL